MLTGRLYGLACVTSSSPIRIAPSVGSSRPATIRSVVVLPQPDGPSSAKNDPDGIVRDRSSTATNVPNRLVTSLEPQVLSPGLRRPCHQLPITFWNASLYVVSSSGVERPEALDLVQVRAVGKINGLSTRDLSNLAISCCAPTTGQM